jgi:hypothetical protein
VTGFRRSWALGFVGLAGLALLGLPSDTGVSGSAFAQLAVAPGCLSHYSMHDRDQVRLSGGQPLCRAPGYLFLNTRKQLHAR